MNRMKGRNSPKRKCFESVDFMKQPFNNVIYHLATTVENKKDLTLL
jgi:hypothetical protein